MNQKLKSGGFIWLAVVIGLGITARFFTVALGHNYDFESYRVVADLLAQGKNVYANTSRYNYGPVWFNVIHVLDLLSGRNPDVFRWLLVGLLSAVDAGIFYILWRKFGKVSAAMFFLNPVSIIITGFTNQFDNLAILIGLCSIVVMGDDFERPLTRRKFSGLLLLGLSLMTKHLFFAFPIWLALKQKGLIQKMLVVTIPCLVFLAGFAPYWAEGKQGIIHNVFMYGSMHNHYLYNVLLPPFLQNAISSQTFWFASLVLFGFVCRNRQIVDYMSFYTAVLVAFSPAISIQYLAIPLVFVAAQANRLSVIYSLIATVILVVHPDCLDITGILPPMFPNIPIYVLAAAVVWYAWPAQITAAGKYLFGRIKGELLNQLGV